MLFRNKKLEMPAPETALPGRSTPILGPAGHYVFSRPLQGPYPEGTETAIFGIGCFWGAERTFWQLGSGIWVTAVGYAGGLTPNATYDEVCTGRTGHNEVVLVVYDPKVLSYATLLKTFWECHDPTQVLRQGNDIGTQYRSGIYWTTAAQCRLAEASRAEFQKGLTSAGYGEIATEILPAPAFYFAEEYHQQYLAKVPNGYCGLRGTGVTCPAPTPAPV
jgi:peptide-methionine (S)-S-oxide reductase